MEIIRWQDDNIVLLNGAEKRPMGKCEAQAVSTLLEPVDTRETGAQSVSTFWSTSTRVKSTGRAQDDGEGKEKSEKGDRCC
uniref:Uncharacterized protein n=1 Tax=Caenorhabditis japonica TaxID=281687 RepID=K7H3R0_CAEJA